MRNEILVGSRGSGLALAQANEVVKALRELTHQHRYRVVSIKTTGDKLSESREGVFDGKGVFTKEIEERLLKGEIQVAVHSMKDLAADLPLGLTVAAVPRRADHRDALISRNKGNLDRLPGGATIGTSSPRRRTQLLATRSDLRILEMHGNVESRLRKLEGGNYDGIVVAAAGLVRLGLEKRITEILSTKIMLPAIGQGAIAVETREDDIETVELVSRLDDQSTRRAVEAERAFARKLGANCRTPVAAYARVEDSGLAIDGMVASPDGRKLLRSQLVSTNPRPESVGEELAESLLGKGAQFILEAV
ncbi:MAG TPA: hydroxymethylbilane synthase [Candidatus Acidoferrales bacterium]|nr:hydroxymethylbilane synthase [Candidatus Acidoferrales bacterium]